MQTVGIGKAVAVGHNKASILLHRSLQALDDDVGHFVEVVVIPLKRQPHVARPREHLGLSRGGGGVRGERKGVMCGVPVWSACGEINI